VALLDGIRGGVLLVEHQLLAHLADAVARQERQDLLAHLGRGREAILRLGRETSPHELAEAGGQQLMQAARVFVLTAAQVLVDLVDRAAVVRHLARRQTIHDGAEREDVGARVDLPARELLGRHEAWRTQDLRARADLRDTEARALGHGLHDTEVSEDDAALRQQHVLRLQVAVHHLMMMRMLERQTQLVADAQRRRFRHVAVLTLHRIERRARDVLHHQEQVVRLLAAVVVELDDVRVLERGDGARLESEALLHVLVGGRSSEHLDRDLPADLRIDREVHLPHRSLTEQALHFVAIDSQRHQNVCPRTKKKLWTLSDPRPWP
jgi:hypothetical protein